MSLADQSLSAKDDVIPPLNIAVKNLGPVYIIMSAGAPPTCAVVGGAYYSVFMGDITQF